MGADGAAARQPAEGHEHHASGDLDRRTFAPGRWVAQQSGKGQADLGEADFQGDQEGRTTLIGQGRGPPSLAECRSLRRRERSAG